MADDKNNIVIKKIKKISGGAHGGAWKVAYADFVTAMMAFFLLLWLLSSTSEAQKEGIADYFTPTVGLRDSKGIGFEGGQSINEDGTRKSELSPIGIVAGAVPPGHIPNEKQKKTEVEENQEAQLLEQAREQVKKAFEDDPALRDFKDNIIVEQTPEGLKITIVDSDKFPMFLSGSAELSEFGKTIMGKLAPIIERMPNFISVTGHTDADPLSLRGGAYTNWELSADRANSARRYLTAKGMDGKRVGKVVGLADMELLLPEEPKSPRNRRISIVLLRGAYFNVPEYLNNRPGSLLRVSAPTSEAPAVPATPSAPAAEPTAEPVTVAPAPLQPSDQTITREPVTH